MFMLIMKLRTSLSMLTRKTFEFSVGVERLGSSFILGSCCLSIMCCIKVGLVFIDWRTWYLLQSTCIVLRRSSMK